LSSRAKQSLPAAARDLLNMFSIKADSSEIGMTKIVINITKKNEAACTAIG